MAKTTMITSGTAPVNGHSCHEMRTELWDAIFPRWVLIIIGGGLIACVAYLMKDMATVKADAAVIRVEIIHVEQTQADEAIARREMRTMLHRIDKAVYGHAEEGRDG